MKTTTTMATSNPTNSAFPKLDRVIRNQRRLHRMTSVVTFAMFAGGAFVAASSLGACGAGNLDESEVGSIVQALNSGDPATVAEYPDLAELLQGKPGARFDIGDTWSEGGEQHTRFVLDLERRTRSEGGELVTVHDRDGHISAYRYVLYTRQAAE